MQSKFLLIVIAVVAACMSSSAFAHSPMIKAGRATWLSLSSNRISFSSEPRKRLPIEMREETKAKASFRTPS